MRVRSATGVAGAAAAASAAEQLNEMIKQRDFWMPFALSIADDRAGDYLRDPKGLPAPYMIMCFDTTAAGRQLVAGISRPAIARCGRKL